MKFQKYRKLKAGVMAVVAVATLTVATVPAAEASNCKFGGVTIDCDHPVSEHVFSDGALQRFVIGTDAAVWTRWTDPQRTSWSSWESMGAQARSGVAVKQHHTQDSVLIGALGTDGYWWSKYRRPSGTWNAWQRYGVGFP
ncbi:hypothetical protein ACIGW4_14520 [Streptomyces sp. NPDC053513]|uniref:hypothetical protein n=1 Tax=unclassified Streptomyces TaxID=2593676 RepID=UPI0037D4C55D